MQEGGVQKRWNIWGEAVWVMGKGRCGMELGMDENEIVVKHLEKVKRKGEQTCGGQ